MTYEEAFEGIGVAIDIYREYQRDFVELHEWEAEKATEALERNIPKEVVKTEFGYKCPVCGAFWATYRGDFIDTNYCPNCGKAVLWGEK